jgi:hypothetical protein
VTDSTGPATPSEHTTPWRAIAVGGAIVVAIVVIAALALPDNDAGTASPGSASPVVSASPIPSPTETDPSSTPEARSSSPGAETPAAIPENWTATATFSDAGKRYVLGDLAAWSDGLVAVGTYYEEDFRSVFGPPPTRAGRVWRSPDGTNWTDATPVGTFADVELVHLFETADGALIVIGQIYDDLDATSAAWETLDGETWTPIEPEGWPEGANVTQVASGARGHVASSFVLAEPHPLYSADGRNWQATLDDGVGISVVAAGDEGFVASTFSRDLAGTTLPIVASADGLEWFDATEPDDGNFLAAPHGGDWIATTAAFGVVGESAVDVATWRSANGLDWSPLGELTLASDELDGATCFETVGALNGLPTMTVAGTLLSGPCSEGAVITAGGSYASLDGVEWTRLPFGDRAFAAGVAMIDDRIVIATDTRTNQAPVVGVTLWISEAP